jgi:hypothetical protein
MYPTKSICFEKFQIQTLARKRNTHYIGEAWSVMVSGPGGVYRVHDHILAVIFQILHGSPKANRVKF